jgi:hypothetical protein
MAEAEQRRLVERKELAARQNLYAADINLAQQAVETGNFGRAEELLAEYLPRPGVEDLRGFEWHHFWHRVRGDSIGVLHGHSEVVSSLRLSPDGGQLYSGGFDGTVRRWSLADRRVRRIGTNSTEIVLQILTHNTRGDVVSRHLAGQATPASNTAG